MASKFGNNDNAFVRFQPLVKFKSHLYYEDKDKVNEALNDLKIAPNSKIIFFKNGKSQGVAFENINAGAYYPSVSIFKSATVSVNFGPSFKYPEIKKEFKCKAVSSFGHFNIEFNNTIEISVAYRCAIVWKNLFANSHLPIWYILPKTMENYVWIHLIYKHFGLFLKRFILLNCLIKYDYNNSNKNLFTVNLLENVCVKFSYVC